MDYSSGLEYVVSSGQSSSYSKNNYSAIDYLLKSVDDNYSFKSNAAIVFNSPYTGVSSRKMNYVKQNEYLASYSFDHNFAPQVFLNPARPSARFAVDKYEARDLAEETFELMMGEKLPEDICINVLPLPEFKMVHSLFGSWSNGILGFSLNGTRKEIFVRENNLDELIIVIGHEIGHVFTPTLPNKHDEEAKAFAFSIEWARTIKKHNIANLGLSIKDELDFTPAKNGLHDVAFEFVNIITRKGRKSIDLHNDLVKKYISIFNSNYI